MQNNINTCDLLSYLIDFGLIDQAQAKIISIASQDNGKTHQETLKELGFLSAQMLQEVLSRKSNIKFVDLSQANINQVSAQMLQKEYCEKNKIIAFDQTDSEVFIGIINEPDIHIKDYLKQVFKKQIQFFLVNEAVLLESLNNVFEKQKDAQNWIEMLDQEYSEEESFATKVVYEIISSSILNKVSDIHFEPEEFYMRIRVRKDGLLKPVCVFPKSKWMSLCVRIKMLANMDIAQCFMPQDGRFDLFTFGRKIDLRVSTRPVVFGENIVIRILDTKSQIPTIQSLGYSQKNIQELEKVMNQKSGVFIVTGPTGAGKSTLLFAMLNRMCDSSVSIATIEDPVEFTCPYFRQTDINAYKNMTFGSALRSILRQDPDIVSISEIRDSDTAVMAMRAAMTGRMLLTTLHTSDIFGVFDRLSELGVEKKMLIHNLNGIAAQRLIRKVCVCAENYQPDEKEKAMLGKFDCSKLKKALGCKKCEYSGYLGRFAVCQVLHINDQVKEMLLNEDLANVKKKILENSSLKNEIRARVVEGMTTIEEANRIICL